MSSTEKNIQVVRRMFLAMENNDMSALQDLVAPDYYNHESVDDGRSELRGPAEVAETTGWLRASFGDLRFEELEIFAADERVFVRVFMHGEHTGEFFGNPATGNQIKHHQWHLFHVVNDKIVSHRAMRDDLGLMNQIRGGQR